LVHNKKDDGIKWFLCRRIQCVVGVYPITGSRQI